MTNDQIKVEYLTNYDFQVYVNKCCQSYHKSPDYILTSPVTVAYLEQLMKGGNNAGVRAQDHGSNDATDTDAAKNA